MCFCNPARDLANELLKGTLELWELPPSLAGLYYLGEHNGYKPAQARLDELERECDRLFGFATRGGFSKPLRPQGLTFVELCRARGDLALADLVEADWKLLLEDRDLSRLALIQERRQLSGTKA